MQINKLTMEGFKNHKDKIGYNLGKLTLITGENYQGKTTIGEAIVWCLMGTDLFGNEKATGRLLNNDSKNMEVEIQFTFQEEQYILTRSRRGVKTDIYLNESLIKATDLIKFYRDKDTFLSIFNPSYFPGLAPKQAKELLNSILQKVPNEDVFKEMSDFETDLLLKNNFKHPNLFLIDKRDELKELEKDVLFSEGFIAAKKDVVEIPDEIIFDNTELESLKSRKKNISERIKELTNVDKAPLIEVVSLGKEREYARSEYTRVTNELKGLKDTLECPNCKFEIDLDGTSRERLNNSIKLLEFQGKELSTKIEQYTKENEKILDIYNKSLENSRNEAEDLENELIKIEELIKLQEEVIRRVDANNSNRKSLLKLQKDNEEKIIKAEEEIASSNSKKTNITMQIEAAKIFNSIKLKRQSNNIGLYLVNVSIQLEKITKDGELKDDFKILYKDREFVTLSNSERIMAGLEISNLIMAQTEMLVPIFIDNAESITKYMAPNTQIIEVKVMKGQELEVKAVE